MGAKISTKMFSLVFCPVVRPMPNPHVFMRMVLTTAVMGVALHAIVNPATTPELQKRATGAIALLLGYWLRGR